MPQSLFFEKRSLNGFRYLLLGDGYAGIEIVYEVSKDFIKKFRLFLIYQYMTGAWSIIV